MEAQEEPQLITSAKSIELDSTLVQASIDPDMSGSCDNGEPNAISNAIGYAQHRSRSHDAVIRVYDDAGNVIKQPTSLPLRSGVHLAVHTG